jgi:hypothetical protein
VLILAILVGVGVAVGGAEAAAADPLYTFAGQVFIGSSATPATTGQVVVEWTANGATHLPQNSVPVAADGTYRITGLAFGTYSVYFRYLGTGAFGSTFYGQSAAVTSGGWSQTVVYGDVSASPVTLPANGRFSGHVSIGTTATAAKAGEVAVSYRVDTGGAQYSIESAPVYTDSSGNYTIPNLPQSSAYRLHFVEKGTAAVQSGWWASGVPSNYFSSFVLGTGGSSTLTTADFLLPPTASLSGHVYLGSTAKPAGAGAVTLTLMEQPDGSNPQTEVPVVGATATTDASGAYTISGITNGQYDVVATTNDPHYTGSVKLRVNVSGTTGGADITLAGTWVVSGHVDLYAGRSAGTGDIQVQALYAGYTLEATAFTDALGNFQLPQLPQGTYAIAYRYAGGPYNEGAQSIGVLSDVAAPNFVMPPSVWISGKVISPSGSALAGITVFADRSDTTDEHSTTTSSDGTYSFAHLAAAKYTVSFVPPDGSPLAPQSWNNVDIYYQSDLVGGTTGGVFSQINATLHAGGSVFGHVMGASDYSAGRVAVEVFILDGSTNTWVGTGDSYPVAADGTYRIDGLLPDDYRFEATYTGPAGDKAEDSAVVHVSASTTTQLDIKLAQGLPGGPPIGSLDAATVGPSMITVSGWALDPDTYQPIAVHLYVDGVFQGQVQADQSRPDVAAAYPGYGSAHGYAVSLVGIAPGTTHTVCAYGINIGAAAVNTPLGCRTVTMHGPGGIASIDSVTVGPGTVTVKGWAIGWSTASPVNVNLSGDFTAGVDWDATTTADGNRPDVAAAFPGYGAAHGFTLVATHVPAGLRFYCMGAYVPTFPITDFFPFGRVGINFATGNCPTVVVPPANPFGSLDAVTTAGPGAVTLGGWAVDPDATTPTVVHVYVDGVPTIALTADGNRPDVAAAFPASGAAHGYSTTLTGLAPGTHQVCTYGINQGAGTGNPQLGCRSVVVRGGNPFGYLEAVTSTGLGSIALNGWAIDPDTASSIVTHLYVDGAFVEQLTASDARPDLAAAFPGYGAAHGVSATLSNLAGGTHTVCLYAINQLAGAVNTPLGCRSVTVPGGNPFGYLDSVKPVALGSIAFSGWAVDPDTASSIPVHVYVDGAFVEQVTASDARPDLAAAFPGYGAAHGVSGTLTNLPGGYHTVCLYAINQLSGSVNTPLGCQRVGLPGGNPFGSVDSVTTTSGSISVAGWAIDPDTAATVSVHLYVDGAFKGAFDAGATRADVAAAFVGYGAAHGYTFSVPATAGPHTACVYAINQGTGTSNPLLGCRAVTVAP